jgi:hypothetical protein
MKSDRRSFLKGMAALVPAAVVAPKIMEAEVMDPDLHVDHLEDVSPQIDATGDWMPDAGVAENGTMVIRLEGQNLPSYASQVEVETRVDHVAGEFQAAGISYGRQQVMLDFSIEILPHTLDTIRKLERAMQTGERFILEILDNRRTPNLMRFKDAHMIQMSMSHNAYQTSTCGITVYANEYTLEQW